MFHGCDLGSWLHFPGYRKCLKTLFERGTAFVVATSFMREKALALGCPANKIHKIALPIPPLHEEHSTRGLKDSVRFLHVGRLHEQKGILYTIEAFAAVSTVAPGSELVIVGDGPQRAQAEALVEALGLGQRVRFRGALPFSEVRREMAAADVYVIHSVTTSAGDTEGFGVSLAEASDARLPVVATRHNGFPDVVLDGATGILVPERDVAAMAEAMSRLAFDASLRERLGGAGRDHVRGSFSPPRIMKEYQSLFLGLIQTGSSLPEGAQLRQLSRETVRASCAGDLGGPPEHLRATDS
jgi:colanic acid/amylovoran biosynthesis glycosyltransferase